MTLIDFIQTIPISLGWTTLGKKAYAQIKDGEVIINVPLFLAEAIIHEFVHHSNPHTDLNNGTCSDYIHKKANMILEKLSESALQDIANEVLKAVQKGGKQNGKVN